MRECREPETDCAGSRPISHGFVGSVVAATLSLRKIILALLVGVFAMLAGWRYVGPARSGAFSLLLAANMPQREHDLPESYEPRHKGHVHLGTGLYIREDEDLVVRGTPPLILRRTYRSKYHIQREFGIGTTHAGEWFIGGDGERFQWMELVLPDGSRVRFNRTSPGSSYEDAVYEHRTSPSEWQQARVGWTGNTWALRRQDDSVFVFAPCGHNGWPTCFILRATDSDGHTIEYTRNELGRLERMQASADRWIAFDYDEQNRITRAYASTRREVRYTYDARGRLSHVKADDGRTHRYGYSDQNELTMIADPGHEIENEYENGRVIRQVNRYPDGSAPYVFDFTYEIENDQVRHVTSKRSDGSWKRLTYGQSRYITSEAWGSHGAESAKFVYERDPQTNIVTSLVLTCPDRTGRPLSHRSAAGTLWEDWVKWDLVRTHCRRSLRDSQPD